MAIDDEEKRKSVSGIVTPNAAKDADWRRQVAGVYSFGGDTPATGVSNGPVFSPTMSPMFSPANPPILLTRA